GFRPAPRARASRRAASERSCEAPIWTVKLPSSRGGGVKATGTAGATRRGRAGGAGTTVVCRVGGTINDAAGTGAAVSERDASATTGVGLASGGDAGFAAGAGGTALRAWASRL